MVTKPRLVVKVGTSTLLEEHELPTSTFEIVGSAIQQLAGEYDIVLVTSGAIGFGVREANLSERPADVHQLQALASIGQVGLIEQWNKAMPGQTVGQVLVTARELQDEASARLLHATFEAMWAMNAVPIVNENDAITNEEISFGDNDKLAALIAVSIGAASLVLLTDQDGVYADFGTDRQRRLGEVSVDDAQQYVTARASQHGTGGMGSKLTASRIAIDGGVRPFIAGARELDAISRALSGETGTKII